MSRDIVSKDRAKVKSVIYSDKCPRCGKEVTFESEQAAKEAGCDPELPWLCPECEAQDSPAIVVSPKHDQHYMTANGKQGTLSQPTYVMILDAARDGLLRDLTGNEFKVLICLALHCDKNLTSWPSYGRVAKETGLTRKTVMKLVGGLIERGLVLRQFHYKPTTTGNQRQTSNRYQVNTPYLSRGEE